MKKWLLRLLGRSGPPAVVVFLSGDEASSRAMAFEMRKLVPDHPQIVVGPAPVDRVAYAYAEEVIEAGSGGPGAWLALRRRLKDRRIALAPFVWTGGSGLRWMPWLLAPRKLLAFNADLERHHLRLSCPVASWRFLRGDSVGDIFRPTIFAPLRRISGLLGFPFLLLCWWIVQRRSPLPLTEREPAYTCEKISLADGIPVRGEVMEGETVTWSLRAWQHGQLAHHERLIFTTISDFRAAASILWRWSPHWVRWKGAIQALDARPAPRLPGPPARNFVPLLDPGIHVFRGRAAGRRRRVAVVTPYLPFPLSHGGAIRIFNLLRAAAADTDIYLFAFAEKETGREVEPLLDFCTRVVLVKTPRWEPYSLLPRGVAKFRSKPMQAAVETIIADERIPIVQIEYTQLAHFRVPAKTILVEHDVTFDLHRQLRRQARGWAKLRASVEESRWRSYELGHARRFDRIIAMSQDDRDRLAKAGVPAERIGVVENGVDLERFEAAPPAPTSEPELLFIGSFRHFPNILGFRFLLDQVWPKLRASDPNLKLVVVAGADHRYYWRRHTGEDLPSLPPQVAVLDFVEDVRPLYRRATVVLAPLVVSAGTNIKVLEALAMARPLVSTTVGAAGLSLTSGENVMLADRPDTFAAAVLGLLWNQQAREELAASGRAFVEEHYNWKTLGKKLLAEWDQLL